MRLFLLLLLFVCLFLKKKREKKWNIKPSYNYLSLYSVANRLLLFHITRWWVTELFIADWCLRVGGWVGVWVRACVRARARVCVCTRGVGCVCVCVCVCVSERERECGGGGGGENLCVCAFFSVHWLQSRWSLLLFLLIPVSVSTLSRFHGFMTNYKHHFVLVYCHYREHYSKDWNWISRPHSQQYTKSLLECTKILTAQASHSAKHGNCAWGEGGRRWGGGGGG